MKERRDVRKAVSFFGIVSGGVNLRCEYAPDSDLFCVAINDGQRCLLSMAESRTLSCYRIMAAFLRVLKNNIFLAGRKAA